MPAANAETMSLHLTAIGRKVAPGSHAALVLDGAGYHIAAALSIPENITLAITVFDDYDDIVIKPAAHGTSSNKIQSASRQSPPELGQQSIFRAVGITP